MIKSEYDKKIIEDIFSGRIQTEQDFITCYLNPITDKSKPGSDYIFFNNVDEVFIEYLHFIGLLKYLEKNDLILFQQSNNSDYYPVKTIKQNHRFSEVRQLYKDLIILKYPSLQIFIENFYRTEAKVSLDTQIDEMKSAEMRYLAERKFKRIAQAITVVLALLSIFASVVSLFLPNNSTKIQGFEKLINSINNKANIQIENSEMEKFIEGDSILILKFPLSK
jgi:hypothetical protein